ncbi:MAG: hypothetical protein QUV05_00110 [Phycisphaerae bacterium]|nr:hypothetical protein [Phycisphaerae bacterium]
MEDQLMLLIVADEHEPLCTGCLALLHACGLRTRMVFGASEAVELASRHDLAGILLRTSGAKQDRDRCLRILAQKKPETPTVLCADPGDGGMAFSMATPGISQCLTEPVSPEALTQALWKVVQERHTVSESPTFESIISASGSEIGPDKHCFRNESWFRMADSGLAVVGLFPSVNRPEELRSVNLPTVGDVVYQGLPLASISAEGNPPRVVASPLSGVIIAVNDEWERDPKALPEASSGEAWLAGVCPTRLTGELACCGLRRVVLVNSDQASAAAQREILTMLGCNVKTARGWAEAMQVLWERNSTIIVIDAASLGANGPEIAARLRSAAPEVRMVVVASAGVRLEAAYRRLGVFYYAIEPFADGEITDILGAMFQPAVETMEGRDLTLEPYCGIRMANRHGREVRLLASGGLLQQGDALGAWICQKLRQRLVPYEMISGDGRLSPAVIRDAAGQCDRLLVLAARDTGRLPGSLVRDGRNEFMTVPPQLAGKVVGLLIQPDPVSGTVGSLRTPSVAFLAEHIVNELTLDGPRSGRSAKASSAGRSGRERAAANRSRVSRSRASGVRT